MKIKKVTQDRPLITLLLVIFFAILDVNAIGQKGFTCPQGYKPYIGYNGEQQRCDEDFDNDGITDLAVVCESKKDMIVVVFLTSKYYISGIYHWFPWQSISNEFSYNNNILTLSSNEGKFGTTLKLKYFADLKNMRLIGYESYFGGAGAADGGAYTKSINLLTNEYSVNGTKKKASFDLITLSNIEKYLDYLASVGQNQVGK
jgi:hypothetical protein